MHVSMVKKTGEGRVLFPADTSLKFNENSVLYLIFMHSLIIILKQNTGNVTEVTLSMSILYSAIHCCFLHEERLMSCVGNFMVARGGVVGSLIHIVNIS